MRVLHRGAESILYIDAADGEKVLVKERVKKGYRISQIDDRLRKYRTRNEVRLMRAAQAAGVPTPRIIALDEASGKIMMEFIDGTRLKELINSTDEKNLEEVCKEVGRLIGRLHANGIVHGDLTTSNMIVCKGKIYFIDFGLGSFSRRIEDQGTDLCLLYEAIRATHFTVLNTCWQNIVKGYREEYKKAEEVLKRVEEIERRARYVDRKTEG